LRLSSDAQMCGDRTLDCDKSNDELKTHLFERKTPSRSLKSVRARVESLRLNLTAWNNDALSIPATRQERLFFCCHE
jgi:hypothetical protein